MGVPREDLAALRQRIAGLESFSPQGAEPSAGCVALGGPLDRMLGGGLARGALHEVLPASAEAAGAAMGFALAAASLATRPAGVVVWVRQDLAALEAGDLYAPGCAELGLDPARLLLVGAGSGAEVLGAAEEALEHLGGAPGASCGAVLAEVWGAPRMLDLTATRRLAMRAERSGALALLLRPGGQAVPSAAATRWEVGAARSRGPDFGRGPAGLGPPAFDLALARSRAGRIGRWTVEWDGDAGQFNQAPAPDGRLPAVAGHRPPAPAAPVVPRAGGWRAAG